MGGVKVVNRLAELLSQKNYEVTLVYPLEIDLGLLQTLKNTIKKYLDKRNNIVEKLYYKPASKVNAIVVKNISEKYIPSGDYIVAVGWQTAKPLASLSLQKGEKIYFLQSYETYFANSQRVKESYHLKMQKIALSNWIMKEMIKIGTKAIGPIGNAINKEEFFVESNIQRKNSLLMLYHPAKIKNVGFGIEVLKLLKKRDENFSAIIFSARQPIHKIPHWVKVIIRPDIATLRRLYNISKIYFSTSRWEGWGLTPMEAMACGCAVVAVKNQGISEFLENEKNSYIINHKNKSQAVDKIIHLLKNEKLMQKFVANSEETLKKFSEDKVLANFENCLKEKV